MQYDFAPITGIISPGSPVPGYPGSVCGDREPLFPPTIAASCPFSLVKLLIPLIKFKAYQDEWLSRADFPRSCHIPGHENSQIET